MASVGKRIQLEYRPVENLSPIRDLFRSRVFRRRVAYAAAARHKNHSYRCKPRYILRIVPSAAR